MRQRFAKYKPATGYSHLIHIALTLLLPAIIFVIVRLGFYQLELGLAVILLSKWRIFAVKPRHWPANLRVNAVDLIVGLSVLVFMVQSSTQLLQLFWAIIYGIWLLYIKPMSNVQGSSIQALIAMTFGFSALFIALGGSSLYVLVILAWLLGYMTSRHFLIAFEEPLIKYLAYVWAYFCAALTWILGHWLLFYGPIAQPALLISILGFGFSGIYYLHRSDKSSVILRRQIVFVVFAILVIIITFSDWGDKAI